MRRIFPIFLLALIAGGCVRSIPNPSGTVPINAGSPVSNQTSQPLAVEPSTGLSIQLPEQTDESIPTQLPIPTPEWSGIADPLFEKTSILEVGYIDVGILIVVLDVQARVEGDYQAVVDEDIFPCTRLEKYPERLYCSGPAPVPNLNQTITLYPIRGGDAVWRGEVMVPEMERE